MNQRRHAWVLIAAAAAVVGLAAVLGNWLAGEPGGARNRATGFLPVDQESELLAHVSGYFPDHAMAADTRDLPTMLERHTIRALVTPSLTDFFTVDGELRGIQVEMLRELEKHLNRDLGRTQIATHVAYIPVPFNQLLPALEEGRGDIAAAVLTRTPERQQRVDFVGGVQFEINEVVLRHRAAPDLASIEDLAGKNVYVLRSGSYVEHLQKLNHDFEQRDLPAINIIEADARLATEDILELVNAGLVEYSVADDYKAKLWAQTLDNVVIENEVIVNRGARAGWAVRKNNPLLRDAINQAHRGFKQGTLIGNLLVERYFGSTRWIDNPLAQKDRERFARYAQLFRKYGDLYQFDWLALVAQAYQESRLDQSKRSPAGAVGIMQLLPSTAADPNVGIDDISSVESNIHAGVKYLAFIRDRYFAANSQFSEADQLAFSWAAYNAGPAKVQRMRERAKQLGLNPNQWFGSVEYAALDLVGQETVRYVSNIYKYYVAYRLSRNLQLANVEARSTLDSDD